MPADRRPIAVIGAGFSGTVAAHHLLHRLKQHRILLFERGPDFARGIAYSTKNPAHLLNVRAENMSAFSDRPEHFTSWLKRLSPIEPGHVHETLAGTFVSRALYANYLSCLIQEMLASDSSDRLGIISDEVTDLASGGNGSFSLRVEGGQTYEVAGAVLAIGNLGITQATTGRIVREPWSASVTAGLTPGQPVVVVGSGLTMVDIVMSLWTSGFSGPVVAISRRGLLPRKHVPASPWSGVEDVLAEESLSGMLKVLRRAVNAAGAADVPWQSVIDALRSSTSATWRGLSFEQQARFLRHLQPWWDVHRHRMAPPIGEQIEHLCKSGYLSVSAGKILSIEDGEEAAKVTWSSRGGGQRTILAQRVIFATGAVPARHAKHTLLDSLLDSGLGHLDQHGLGLDVDPALHVIGSNGHRNDRLWAVGPIIRGALWECTAVPDIRRDAELLAKSVEKALGSAAKR